MACTPYNPVVTFDDACPTVKTGSLDKMFLTRAKVADQLPNPFDLDDLTDRIDNADTAGNPMSGAAPIREFTIIGSMPERETSQQTLPLGDVFPVRGNLAIPYQIKDLTAANIAWAIGIADAGGVKYKAWFQGSDLFIGGYQGMNGFITANLVYAEDRTTLVSINGTFTTIEKMNAAATTFLPTYN